MSARGIYGTPLIGGDSSGESGSSLGTWIVGGLLVGSAVLWARHQSRQIEQLYKTAGLPQQSFAEGLRQGAGASLRGLAERVRPKRLPQGRND